MLLNGIRSALFERQIQDDELKINFHQILKEKLYLKNIKSVNSKEDLKYFVKNKELDYALHDKFISYGTKTATNFIIIDIDNYKKPLAKYEKEVDRILDGYKPSWILKTDKGFHIGFILDKPVFYNNSIEMEKFYLIKKTLSVLFDADVNASIRKNGYYRNPFMHDSILNTNIHKIDELHKHINKIFQNCISLFDSKKQISEKFKNKNKTVSSINSMNWDEIKKEGFRKGNRNNFLFGTVLKLVYNNKIRKSEVLAVLQELNNNELRLEELKRIQKSILKYAKNKKTNSKKVTKEYEYVKGEYWEDMNLYGIHNIKKDNRTIFNRQKLGQKIRTVKVIHKTINTLVNSYKEIYQSKNKQFTNKKIEEYSNVSKRTIQRYRNDRNLERSLKNQAFKLYILELGHSDSVMANVTPSFLLLNSAVEKVDFFCERTQRTFVFLVNHKNKLFFLPKEEKYYESETSFVLNAS